MLELLLVSFLLLFFLYNSHVSLVGKKNVWISFPKVRKLYIQLIKTSLSSFQVPVSNYRNPILELAAFDQQGRKFDNFSSLSVQWESSKVSVASIEPGTPMELLLIKDGNKQMKLHGDSSVIVFNQTH